MNKRKLKILQITIGLCVSLLFLSSALNFAEAALVNDNIEGLTEEEFRWNSECTEAGGMCIISLESYIYGISLAD